MAVGWKVPLWDGLTPDEKAFVRDHPKVAFDFFADSVLAKRETQQRWAGKSFRHVNGPENAFQHAFWNALMAWGYGGELARQFADAHEARPNNPKDQRAMDEWNNAIGRWIGSTLGPWNGNIDVANRVYDLCIVLHWCTWLANPP